MKPKNAHFDYKAPYLDQCFMPHLVLQIMKYSLHTYKKKHVFKVSVFPTHENSSKEFHDF